jgi:hypothetical protein
MNDEVSTIILISFQCNLFESLSRHTCTFKLTMDSTEVDRNKAIGLEEIEKFIKKVVGIVAYKCEQVLNIIVVE